MNIGLAVGLAAFMPSRVVVGVLIAWSAIVANLLTHIGSLGGARRFINVAAAQHLLPTQDRDVQLSMSTAFAVAVMLVWIFVFQRAGQWWTERRDI
jgi:hypothetical protein